VPKTETGWAKDCGSQLWVDPAFVKWLDNVNVGLLCNDAELTALSKDPAGRHVGALKLAPLSGALEGQQARVLARLASFSDLRTLDLTEIALEDDLLAILRPRVTLRALSMAATTTYATGGVGLTRRGLVANRETFMRLQSLVLGGAATEVCFDAGLIEMGLTNLRSLNIRSEVDQVLLTQVKSLSKLEELRLKHHALNDASVALIRQMSKLTRLSLETDDEAPELLD
jgi:hypothetical protein